VALDRLLDLEWFLEDDRPGPDSTFPSSLIIPRTLGEGPTLSFFSERGAEIYVVRRVYQGQDTSFHAARLSSRIMARFESLARDDRI